MQRIAGFEHVEQAEADRLCLATSEKNVAVTLGDV